MKKLLFATLLFLGIACANSAQGQKVAVKTNLLYDATATFNLGLEFGIAPKWTFDIEANYNPWTFSNGKRWQHWMVQPELRYWTCNRFAGHFFALQGAIGEVDLSHVKFFDFWAGNTDYDRLRFTRTDGWFWSAGIGYGYDWAIAKHWNIEFEIAVGYAQQTFDQYGYNYHGHADKFGHTRGETTVGEYNWSKDIAYRTTPDKGRNKWHKYYIGPTKAAITLVYVF